MESVKIGFVPAHREPFGEDWASKMRKRCLDVFAKIPGLEIVVPDESLTDRGFVRNDADGRAQGPWRQGGPRLQHGAHREVRPGRPGRGQGCGGPEGSYPDQEAGRGDGGAIAAGTTRRIPDGRSPSAGLRC